MSQAKRIILHNEQEETLKKVLTSESKTFMLDVEQAIRVAFDKDIESGMALLFDYYYGSLCSHALRFVMSKTIAEDIVSDIFYEFHVHQRHTYITTSFRAFLFTAVRNRAFDCLKTEMKRNVSIEDALALSVDSYQLPDAITQFEELYQDFQNVINEMPLKRRQIYLMDRFEGKKQQDIAAELDISTRTVEAHIYQAIRQIREALKDKWLILIISGTLFLS
jgi:RNA polymerase sigma-70 factor (family 1)